MVMIQEYIQLAYKSLKHRGVRTWLTLLGICIGVMAVVALIGLGQGLQEAVNAQFGVSSTQMISIQAGGLSFGGPPGSGVATPLTTKDMDALQGISNIDGIIRRNIETAQLEFNKRSIITSVTNVPDAEQRKMVYEFVDVQIEEGRLLQDGDTGQVILGYNFYVNKVGLEKEIEIGDNVIIQGRKFKVIGLLEKKGSFIFDNIIFMNEEDIRELYEYGDQVDIIGVKVKDSEKMQKTKEDIVKELRKSRNVKEGEEDFKVETPQATLETVNQVVNAVTIFISIIAAISIFVGAIGIVNTMTTSVVERKKEIGVMKAIGAKNEHIFWQFFIEAGLLGLIGGVVGVTLGTAISVIGVYTLTSFLGAQIPINLNIVVIASALISSFIIGAISGVLPALHAAHEDPVEALRG